MRKRTGSIFRRKANKHQAGGWWARVTFNDPVTGKKRDIQRRASTRLHACELRDQLLREIDESDGRTLRHERASVGDLADYYAATFLKPAEYVHGVKVAGLKGYRTDLGRLRVIKMHFGGMRLRALTYGDLRLFRASRLATDTVRGRQRTIAALTANSLFSDAC
jgi:hypothetical protein